MTWTEKKFADVNGHRMAYVESGKLDGDPIVFLHGNPTSSYLWRNIIPYAESFGRCIAPDLIGMGDSDKLPGSGPDRYRFVEHREYLDALLDQLGVNSNVTLVIHDWGSGLGFDWANRHRDVMKGIAYMEAMVWPRHWSDIPEERVGAFKRFRTPEGEAEAIEKNLFVEVMLFERGIIRDLSDAEKEVYRYPTNRSGGTKLPGVIMPNDIPFDGEPAESHAIVKRYADWLVETDTPKLFINADEGHGLAGAAREHARTFKNQREVTVHGRHYMQEDVPDEVGAALAGFVRGLRG